MKKVAAEKPKAASARRIPEETPSPSEAISTAIRAVNWLADADNAFRTDGAQPSVTQNFDKQHDSETLKRLAEQTWEKELAVWSAFDETRKRYILDSRCNDISEKPPRTSQPVVGFLRALGALKLLVPILGDAAVRGEVDSILESYCFRIEMVPGVTSPKGIKYDYRPLPNGLLTHLHAALVNLQNSRRAVNQKKIEDFGKIPKREPSPINKNLFAWYEQQLTAGEIFKDFGEAVDKYLNLHPELPRDRHRGNLRKALSNRTKKPAAKTKRES